MANAPADIAAALKKVVFFDVKQDLSGLSVEEKEALAHCIKAAKIINELYLTQIDPGNLTLRETLAHRTDEAGKNLLLYFDVQGGPWDSFNEHRSFISGVGEKSKGSSFYPGDLTKEEWEEFLIKHPEARTFFESRYSVIRRVDGTLKALPYNEFYNNALQEAALELRSASRVLPEGNLKKFLGLQADAFLSNNYWDSNIAWIDTDGIPFEVTIGPHEVYEDRLFGLKTTFEAFIALPDKEATAELQKFSGAVPEFDAVLAKQFGYQAKGGATPLEVVLDIYRGGEASFGRQFVAYNLPNDRKIHEIKGSKKVFSRTMMEAKFSKIGRPIAERVLRPEDLKYFQFHNRLLFVLGHELAHGLGPGVRNVDGREVSFEILLKDLHSMLEEAKADMLGAALLNHFYSKGLLNHDELVGCVVTEIALFAQGWVASYTEAHSAGSLIEYNWLKHHGGVRYDESKKVFDINYEKALQAMIWLSDAFMKLQMDGDYAAAADFVKRWGFVADEIPGIVARMNDLPIEVHPVF